MYQKLRIVEAKEKKPKSKLDGFDSRTSRMRKERRRRIKTYPSLLWSTKKGEEKRDRLETPNESRHETHSSCMSCKSYKKKKIRKVDTLDFWGNDFFYNMSHQYHYVPFEKKRGIIFD